jgi:NhaP-type Na+/H+ or K+/H+ antiporter
MYIVIGILLVFMALTGSLLKRLPVSTAMLYLAVGVALGPHFAGWIDLDPTADDALLERVTEVAVIVSLFTAGLKLRVPVRDPMWRPAVRLASVSMALTVALVAATGHVVLGLSPGAALLLGGILAPTDPVLASEVQVADPDDRDRLRFTLTGEAGLNDGAAFPFVVLGLGLLGAHDLGAWGWRWLAVDVVWAAAAGLTVGWLLGTGVGHVVTYLRREYRTAIGLDEFLTLGLIALAYGTALAARAYGFLAVFAAGLALSRIERRASRGGAGQGRIDEPEETAMARTVLGFNEQLERLGEVAVVLVLGALLAGPALSADAVWFAPLLFLGIRPIAALIGLARTPLLHRERRLVAWFGIRGIGSLYYLFYALAHGLHGNEATTVTGLVLSTVAVSILAHGISVTPLMRRHEDRRGRTGGPPPAVGRRAGEASEAGAG